MIASYNTESEFRELTLGFYQMKHAQSYTDRHFDEMGNMKYYRNQDCSTARFIFYSTYVFMY